MTGRQAIRSGRTLDELGVVRRHAGGVAGDNGPEDVLPRRGTPGYWEGSYFAGGEGSLRTPCLVRWPGRIQPGRTSDEIPMRPR